MKKLFLVFIFGAVLGASQEAGAYGPSNDEMLRRANGEVVQRPLSDSDIGILTSLTISPFVLKAFVDQVESITGSAVAGFGAYVAMPVAIFAVATKTSEEFRKNDWRCCRRRKASPTARSLRDAVKKD